MVLRAYKGFGVAIPALQSSELSVGLPVIEDLATLLDAVLEQSIVLGTSSPTLDANSVEGWISVEYGDHVKWSFRGVERSVPWEVACNLPVAERLTLAGAVSALYVLAL